MKTNQTKFFGFLLLFSLLLVSPILAQTTVDMDVNWIGTQTAPTYYEGDVVMFNTRLVNYGADYLTGVVELSRVDGQPIATIPIGQGIEATIISVFENYNIVDSILSEDVHFQTKDFTYAGYTFDIPNGDYQLKALGRGYVGTQYTTDTDYLYFTLSEEQTQDENGTELMNLSLNIECTDELRAGDVLTCQAIVTDDNGNFIEDANVNFNENLFGTCDTDSFGFCEINYTLPTFLIPDTYYVTAVASKLNYTNATDLESYVVVETIIVQNTLEIVNYYCKTPTYFGENLYCFLNVIDNESNFVTDADVQFTINGISLGVVVQDGNTYYVNYQPPVYLTGEGNYLIRADANKVNYVGDTKYFQVELKQHQVSLSIDCNDYVYVGDNLVCEAKATDEFNISLDNTLVIFELENQTTSCVTTSVGVCAVEFNIDNSFIENQTYTVNAQAMKDYYLPGYASTTFTVLPTGVVIDKDMFLNIDCADEIYLNDELICEAKVTQKLTTQSIVDKLKAFFFGDSIGSPVENAKVIFNIDTTQHNQELVCMTDSAGVCQVSKKILSIYGYVEGETYTVAAMAQKDGYVDAFDEDLFNIISIPLNYPTAIIEGPVNANINEKIIFDGSNSLPGIDAVIVEYTWTIVDINGTTIMSAWSSGASLPYTFYEEGIYTIILEVTNSNNLSDLATHMIAVKNDGENNYQNIFDNEEGIKVTYFQITGISDSVIEIGGDFTVEATIESFAQKDLEQVRLTFYLPEYGIQFKSAGTTLDKGEKKTLLLHGFLPYDIEPGIYYPMIGLSDKEIRRMKVGYLEVVEN